MIKIAEDCEFSMLIASFIESLASADVFLLKIWITGTEVPLMYTDEDDYDFYDNGVKIIRGNKAMFLFYDTINGMEISTKGVF